MSRYPDPGTVIAGKYLVETLIGEGGMGAVLKAKHISLDAHVAIKCLLPEMMERKDVVARFIREGTSAFKLRGEHVARVLDVGKLDDGIPYIAMEYLEGADLNAILKHHGPQHPQIAVDLVLQACEALAEAHAIGIIHRDVKASNFFVMQPPGAAPQLKVLDFGIATLPEGASDLTSTQSVIGTPSYMAPEQMRSSRTADQRSDIWSLGVVLYELLEGARPFRSEVYSELCLKVGMDPPERFSIGVPDPLQAIVFRCLEKPVERRYQSVAELAFDLMPYASNPVIARATVEQCARLLGRRSTRTFDSLQAQGSGVGGAADRTPGPLTPSGTPVGLAPPLRLTPPPARVPVSAESGELTQAKKTPTSVQLSSGQLTGTGSGAVAMPVAPQRRRGGWVVSALVASVLIGAGALAFVLVTGGDESTGTSTSPASSPAATSLTPAAPPPAAPVAVDPPPPAPPPAVPVVATGSDVGSASESGSGSGSAVIASEPISPPSPPPVITHVTPKPPHVTPKPPPTTKPPTTVKPPPSTTTPPVEDPFSHRD